MEELTEDIIKFDTDSYSGMISNGEILSQDPIFMNNDTEDDESEVDDIIILHMDIRQPLSTLRSILEQRVGVPLKNYQFWLQDAQMLESHKNLVDQCVQGEGVVQINVQVLTMTTRINIVDVLKPTEDVLETINSDDVDKSKEDVQEVENTTDMDINTVVDDEEKDNAHVIKWVVDKQFKKDQLRLHIPDNPLEWTSAMVRHWLQWAVRQFNLTQIKLNDWMITGVELCNMSLQEFQNKVKDDPGEIFWTHLELLRKCKFVAVIQKNVIEETEKTPTVFRKATKVIKPQIKIVKQTGGGGHLNYEFPISGNRSGNNGQIQLWQFLLDILTDRKCRNIIHWLSDGNGEFKLHDPERVAQLWGERKNKPTMNYEKLSRALRYYYDGDMISKVYGKRFVYQFVCDLKQLIGYSAEELAYLVNETPTENLHVHQ